MSKLEIDPDKLYTATQAAKLIGVARSSMNNYLNNGEIEEAYRTSNNPQSHWRIPGHALIAHLKRIGKI